MAFWAIEVKPRTPVTHPFTGLQKRLRIIQAIVELEPSIELGSTWAKISVRCRIGVKTPVLICVLDGAGKGSRCSLDLELEEQDDVVFSVDCHDVTDFTVTLSGYYVGKCAIQMPPALNIENIPALPWSFKPKGEPFWRAS